MNTERLLHLILEKIEGIEVRLTAIEQRLTSLEHRVSLLERGLERTSQIMLDNFAMASVHSHNFHTLKDRLLKMSKGIALDPN